MIFLKTPSDWAEKILLKILLKTLKSLFKFALQTIIIYPDYIHKNSGKPIHG